MSADFIPGRPIPAETLDYFYGMARISILTPYRNAEKYLAETARSVLSQSYTDWEWILVNDHSTENELQVLQEFRDDPRIVLLENEGKGIVDALCLAFAHATGEFITRMDADDVMPAFKLERFLSFLEREQVRIVTGKVKYFSADSISPGYRAYEDWLNDRLDKQDFYEQIYRECTLASGNWMMRKKDLEACGGFTALNYPEDYDLLFRWYKAGFGIKGLNEVTHWWRDHAWRTSKTSENYQQKAFFDLKITWFIDLDWDPKQPLILNGTGQKGRLTAKVLIEHEIPFTWVSHEPEKFAAGIFGQAVCGVSEIPLSEKIQLLNATLIPSSELENMYRALVSEIQFFGL